MALVCKSDIERGFRLKLRKSRKSKLFQRNFWNNLLKNVKNSEHKLSFFSFKFRSKLPRYFDWEVWPIPFRPIPLRDKRIRHRDISPAKQIRLLKLNIIKSIVLRKLALISLNVINFVFNSDFFRLTQTKQVLRSTILSLTILLVFFDNSRIGRF